jgi:hypothetical protein
MAVMIGNTHHVAEHIHFSVQPVKWIGKQLCDVFSSSRHNPSPFPDRVWSHHSALLDAAWKQSRNNRAG